MIILDTNVVSELMRAAPDPAVMGWVDGQRLTDLWITATSAGELEFGAARLPAGRRKRALTAEVVAMVDQTFARRVLVFDRAAAAHYAVIAASRERAGRRIRTADAQIAAVCRARNAPLATRNTKDFDGTGVELINPWD